MYLLQTVRSGAHAQTLPAAQRPGIEIHAARTITAEVLRPRFHHD
jgi:hypothetical protein